MSSLILNNQATSPGTPASGKSRVWFDSTSKQLKTTDDAGFNRGGLSNFSTVNQSFTAATRTYMTGSNIAVPVTKLQIGSCFRWGFSLTKNANGTATSTIDICVGTAGTTADTARVSFTKPAGTAVADEAWFQVMCVCRGPLSASGIFVGQMQMTHNLQITGHAVIPCVVVNTVSGAFDVTTAGLIVGLCITTGTADVCNTQIMQAEAWNL